MEQRTLENVNSCLNTNIYSYFETSVACTMTIVIDNSSIFIKWSFKLIDTVRGVIYDRHMFIVRPQVVKVVIYI